VRFLVVMVLLFLVVVAATVVARSIAFSSAGDGLPLTIGSHVSDTPWTPLSTEKDQARTLAAQLGGEAKDYSRRDTGWLYTSNGTTPVKFTVPNGALVDTRRGMRWEGQRVQAAEFFIWWP
jgi:opacity protein-like surface antigen